MSAAEVDTRVPCTHEPIDLDDDILCHHDQICHICESMGRTLYYCQYQINGDCLLCGRQICNDHLGSNDHIKVCSICYESNNEE